MSGAPLKIVVVGLRGMPYVQGGIETHASELYPRLTQLGAQVVVVGRKRFRPGQIGESWQNVRLHWLWAPRRPGFEAAIHTLLGVLYAAIHRPDVLHIHAIGPAIVMPLAKALRLRVVVTHHGQDYLREKWGRFEKIVIRLGEFFAVHLSDALICVSSNVRSTVLARYGRQGTWIPNGVARLDAPSPAGLLAGYGLKPGQYVIQIGRLVPEKRQLDLIRAFRAANLADWKLVLVGGSQGSDLYEQQVRQAAGSSGSVICTGAMKSTDAHGLLRHAGLFVLPSSHEGLPIALLEAIAYRIPSLASDIPGNREIGLHDSSYFAVGDIETLARRMKSLAESNDARELQMRHYAQICRRFDWDHIAQATMTVMRRAAVGRLDRMDDSHQPEPVGRNSIAQPQRTGSP